MNRHAAALVPTSTVPIRIRTRQASCRSAYEPDNLLAPIRLRNDPDNLSCRYAYDPDASTVLLPTRTRPQPRILHRTDKNLPRRHRTVPHRTAPTYRITEICSPTHPPLYTAHDPTRRPGGGRGGTLPASGTRPGEEGPYMDMKEGRRAARSEEGNRTSFSKASPSGEDCSVAGDKG
jgi:hypothetical protein